MQQPSRIAPVPQTTPDSRPLFHGRGSTVVAIKVRASLETLSSLFFKERNLGCPRKFAGMPRSGDVQNVCAKKVRARVLFPKKPQRHTPAE